LDVFELGWCAVGFGIAGVQDEVVFDAELLKEPDDDLDGGELELLSSV